MKKEIIISIVLPLVLSICCFIFANRVLPKDCSLFVSNVPGPQMCHTIPMPSGCDSYCKDVGIELIASIIAGVGVCLLFLPIIIYVMRDFRSRPVKQTKIFN